MRLILRLITLSLFVAAFGNAAFAQTNVVDGTWVAKDSSTQGMLRLVIRGSEVHGFWTCVPNPCDLGFATGNFYASVSTPPLSGAGVWITRFNASFGESVVFMRRTGTDELQVETYTRFTDGSGRKDSADSQTFTRLEDRGSDLQAIPQFPWPPPKWTSRYMLADGLVTSGRPEPLGALFDRVVSALRRAVVEEWSSYAIGDDGFAVVSRLESIDDEGKPRPGAQRWATGAWDGIDTLRKYLSALFKARPGRYRVIAFVVTARAVGSGSEEPDPASMNRLLREGSTALPDILRSRTVTFVRCEALIYEFFQASEDDQIRLVESSRLRPTQHLSGAGLWKEEDLRR